ncbi:hypothetical protein OUZ56_030685 [Daphnia magna]|uniref:Uncharacterized protein n=1 Tax=Daphnia magna TaxID=35525 RepID=A0ABQ9ZS11_9CRUS|nr:hypothetical protein OUZ56_030685 [Daphnia magna]
MRLEFYELHLGLSTNHPLATYHLVKHLRARISFASERQQQRQQQAHIQVVAHNLYGYDSSRTPMQYGMFYRKMGMNAKDANCETQT